MHASNIITGTVLCRAQSSAKDSSCSAELRQEPVETVLAGWRQALGAVLEPETRKVPGYERLKPLVKSRTSPHALHTPSLEGPSCLPISQW